MIREIVKIDEDLCDGCGLCIPNCHEGALQIIDGKARLISELMCDGLGACLGHCPQGAIEIEKREAEEYDEVTVIKQMIPKGENLVIAHLKHLKDHGETGFLQEAVRYLKAHENELEVDVNHIIREVHNSQAHAQAESGCASGGCPGSAPVSFERPSFMMAPEANTTVSGQSELQQWPVQMHLINPAAGYFQGADLLVAADCAAFAHGSFHQTFIKGKKLVIACPKLDQGKEIYVEKLVRLIEQSKVNTITVVVMEVPCCGGLSQLVEIAIERASRKVPVKEIVVGIRGDVLAEEWI
ncbi:ATP-binding protein [Sunxiuqinia elliptica]|uniref:4Fe-4S binding protein n=1 Tax=Sunxiuqinia elliptica TaxID=655355 RepID=A0A4R6H7G9_9BACT|nr:4Fe-4S binding protein [Sunxiuqinia elliptica]TDO03954.1 4Fe-4S binding protein [Sunxiuqinia elliptica]TDO62236.1 4Fe-4S binding protein [Sunxiuqinia elliptica]